MYSVHLFITFGDFSTLAFIQHTLTEHEQSELLFILRDSQLSQRTVK